MPQLSWLAQALQPLCSVVSTKLTPSVLEMTRTRVSIMAALHAARTP
jgi:hypothetical protein